MDLRRQCWGNWKVDISSCLGTLVLLVAALLGCWDAVGVCGKGCITSQGPSPMALLSSKLEHLHSCLCCLLGWISSLGKRPWELSVPSRDRSGLAANQQVPPGAMQSRSVMVTGPQEGPQLNRAKFKSIILMGIIHMPCRFSCAGYTGFLSYSTS